MSAAAPGDRALDAQFARIAQEIDASFAALLPAGDDARARLLAAIRHAAVGGGKRVRPLLTLLTATMLGADRQLAVRVGTAIEAVHIYSLIHDDLPCMDDDDLRRGKPTVHKAFDEATAVLAGDGLQAFAFELLADPATSGDPFLRIELVRTLAAAAGINGMVGGQALDLAAATQAFDLGAVTRLQQMKTGALLAAAVEMGAILGHLAPEGRTHLRGYARDLGLAFQITDDLIDATGSAATAGKAVGKDAAAGKQTFVSLLGIARAREQAALLVDQAVAHLAAHGPEADGLRALARFVGGREQ